MFKEVFISHAKEDISFAEQLYDYLSEKGYDPWLDKRKLKVGANWDYEIKKALKESTFVIILLSSTSVKKRGYVQKEFKYALDYSENKLIDDIYIIPILLDKCQVPEQLSQFQWIEVDNVNFKENILESLNFQRQKYLSSLSPDSIQLNDYTSISINLNVDVRNGIDYICDLPLFQNNLYFDSNFVNTFIQQKALETISNYRSWIIEIKDAYEGKDTHWYINISHNIKYLSKDYLSMSIINDSFIAGVHPITTIDTLNFKFNPDTLIRLRDFVEYGDIKQFLIKYIKKYGKTSLLQYIDHFSDENVNFVFDEKVLEISLINVIPRIMMGFGTFEIPISELKLRK